MGKVKLSILKIAVIVGLILLIPLTLQLTIGTGVDGQGWNWKVGDFIVMGILLFITGLAIDFSAKKYKGSKYSIVAIIVILALFFLIWVHLAVGIVDSWPFAGS